MSRKMIFLGAAVCIVAACVTTSPVRAKDPAASLGRSLRALLFAFGNIQPARTPPANVRFVPGNAPYPAMRVDRSFDEIVESDQPWPTSGVRRRR